MKTLVDINLSLLKDYQDFADSNPDWSIGSYVDFKYDINTAIGFGKFYFPTFIERKNCIILESRFDEEIFENWYQSLNSNIEEIEKMCNLYAIKDYFQFNSKDYTEAHIEALSKLLKISLEINLKCLYPDLKFQVDIFDYYDEKHITFYHSIL